MFNTKKFKNIYWITASGYFSIFVSLIKNFLFAIIFSTMDYAQIQSYILYAGYSWFFLFGLTDGIYLKYGQLDYDELPKTKFRFFTHYNFISQSIIFLIFSFFSFFSKNPFIYFNITIAIFIGNMIDYFSMVNQFTRRFAKDSLANILWNFSTLIFIFSIIFFKLTNYKYAIIGMNFTSLIYIIILFFQHKEIIFGARESYSNNIKEVFELIKSGFFVMLSVTIGRIVMNTDKLFVDNLFDRSDFANFSFAVSIITMMFNVVNSSSKIIFPFLTRQSDDKKSYYFILLNNLLTIIASLICSVYFIMSPLVIHYIPRYELGVKYLGILFPCLIFKILFNMVSDNFFKSLKKIKAYTINGIITLSVAVILNFLSYFLFKSVSIIAVSSVVTFIFWQIINDLYFLKYFSFKINDFQKKYLLLFFTLLLFYLCMNLPNYISFICYVFLLSILIFVIFKDQLNEFIKLLKGNDR